MPASGENRVSLTYPVLIAAFRVITSLICRIHDSELVRVPHEGPLILATNHVNIIELPIIYTRLYPRRLTALGLADRWDKGWSRFLMEASGAVPLHRGEADVAAIRKALQQLELGKIVLIAPEGTRSGHGRLEKAHAGIVLLALHSGAPVLPVVYYGSEDYKENLRRLRRTDFYMAVGQPFRVDAGGVTVTRSVRQRILDEIMYQMSALLPPQYRGVYSDLSSATQRYLVFEAS